MSEKVAEKNVIPSEDLNIDIEVDECQQNGYILDGQFLGAGAYAKVYSAKPTIKKIKSNYKLRSLYRKNNNFKVAIKVANAAKAPDKYLYRFLPREISTMSICYGHPNVVQLLDMFATKNRVYMVIKFAEKGDLLRYVNKVYEKRPDGTRGAIPEEEARDIFRGVARGLQHLHSINIAHRDLKCENLLLDDEMNAFIADFGFAIQTSMKFRAQLLRTHCGSYAYAAPEVLRQEVYDGRSADLWSLGVVLYAILHGTLPFRAKTPKEVLKLMKRNILFKQNLSPDCKNLLRGLLRRRPNKRIDVNEVFQHPWMTAARLGNKEYQPKGAEGDTSTKSSRPEVLMMNPRRPGKFDCASNVLDYFREVMETKEVCSADAAGDKQSNQVKISTSSTPAGGDKKPLGQKEVETNLKVQVALKDQLPCKEQLLKEDVNNNNNCGNESPQFKRKIFKDQNSSKDQHLAEDVTTENTKKKSDPKEQVQDSLSEQKQRRRELRQRSRNRRRQDLDEDYKASKDQQDQKEQKDQNDLLRDTTASKNERRRRSKDQKEQKDQNDLLRDTTASKNERRRRSKDQKEQKDQNDLLRDTTASKNERRRSKDQKEQKDQNNLLRDTTASKNERRRRSKDQKEQKDQNDQDDLLRDTTASKNERRRSKDQNEQKDQNDLARDTTASKNERRRSKDQKEQKDQNNLLRDTTASKNERRRRSKDQKEQKDQNDLLRDTTASKNERRRSKDQKEQKDQDDLLRDTTASKKERRRRSKDQNEQKDQNDLLRDTTASKNERRRRSKDQKEQKDQNDLLRDTTASKKERRRRSKDQNEQKDQHDPLRDTTASKNERRRSKDQKEQKDQNNLLRDTTASKKERRRRSKDQNEQKDQDDLARDTTASKNERRRSKDQNEQKDQNDPLRDTTTSKNERRRRSKDQGDLVRDQSCSKNESRRETKHDKEQNDLVEDQSLTKDQKKKRSKIDRKQNNLARDTTASKDEKRRVKDPAESNDLDRDKTASKTERRAKDDSKSQGLVRDQSCSKNERRRSKYLKEQKDLKEKSLKKNKEDDFFSASLQMSEISSIKSSLNQVDQLTILANQLEEKIHKSREAAAAKTKIKQILNDRRLPGNEAGRQGPVSTLNGPRPKALQPSAKVTVPDCLIRSRTPHVAVYKPLAEKQTTSTDLRLQYMETRQHIEEKIKVMASRPSTARPHSSVPFIRQRFLPIPISKEPVRSKKHSPLQRPTMKPNRL